MKVLVSACLLGENCKYDGKNNKSTAVAEYVKGMEVVSICPEILAGMGSPRKSVELKDGKVINCDGEDLTKEYQEGVNKAIQLIADKDIDLAILQSRSPTCGVKQIYDGTFSGRLIEGSGLLAQALQDRNIRVLDAEELNQPKETLRLKKTEWMNEQISKQRKLEDELQKQMLEEQRILDGMNTSIDDSLQRSRETREYNRNFQEYMNRQVYTMHGISDDKLQGIREYKNAYYRGCAFSLFFLSVVLTVLCGFVHGFTNEISLFMFAYTGIEGTLLMQDQGRSSFFGGICRLLYLFIFPVMLTVFVSYELKSTVYSQILPWLVIAGVAILAAGTLRFFLYNPYRQDEILVSKAKDTIEEIERLARKELKKSQRDKEREEEKAKRRLMRTEKRKKLKEKLGQLFDKIKRKETT